MEMKGIKRKRQAVETCEVCRLEFFAKSRLLSHLNSRGHLVNLLPAYRFHMLRKPIMSTKNNALLTPLTLKLQCKVKPQKTIVYTTKKTNLKATTKTQKTFFLFRLNCFFYCIVTFIMS